MSFVVNYIKSLGLDPYKIKKEDLHKLNIPKHITVIRVYHNGTLKISKPCSDCLKLLKLCAVEKVTYSTSDLDNPFIKERVVDIDAIESSNRIS